MKGKLGFFVFIVAVAGLLLLYTFTSKEYPPMPPDDTHRQISAISACMECHESGKKYAMKQTHPPKFDCPKCHKAAKSATPS